MSKNLLKLAARAKIHSIVLAGTAAVCCGLINTAQAIPLDSISQVYFFGDSLSDSGFNDNFDYVSTLPPGKAPTFTTFSGYTWAQYVARDIKGFVLPQYNDAGTYPRPNPSFPDNITNNSIYLGAGIPFVSGSLNGIDYAAAGSTTNSTGVGEPWAPSLHQQISKFLSTAGPTLDPNAVYFIWEGANDLLAVLSPTTTQLQFLIAANTAAINIANEVALLSSRGAQRFVILSLPNIGITPLITGIGIPTLPAAMKTVTYTFNSMLNQALGQVIAQYKIKVLYIDTYTLLDNVINTANAGQPSVIGGQSFLFTNTTTPACGAVPAAIYCPSGTPTGYIFADTLHPTDMAHHLLALYVEQQIQNWK